MNEGFLEKLKRFSDLVINYKNYEKQLEDSLVKTNRVFDFAIIVFWKLFMLFVYERLQQIRYFLEEDVFEQKWKTIFKQEKYDLIKYDKRNLYAYNQLDDDEVIGFLNLLYPIDSNFLKKLKSLKQDRHTAGHVCDPNLTNQESNVVNFTTELLVVVEKLQLEHEKNYLSQVELLKFIEDKVTISNADKKFLVDRTIESLASIPSFNSAKAPLQFIENNLSILDVDKKKEIIQNSLKNRGVYNQIIESSYGPTFFKSLYEDGALSLNDWQDFYIESTIANSGKELGSYYWLKENLSSANINIDEIITRKKKEFYSDTEFRL